MNDVISPTEPVSPPKNTRKKRLWLAALFLVAVAAGALWSNCPWLNHPHGAMTAVTGTDKALLAQIEALDRRVQNLENHAEPANAAPSVAVGAAAPEAKADPATAVGLSRVQSDLVALSSAMSALQSEVKVTGTTANETREASASLIASVVGFIQLREAAASGRPFVAELGVMREASKNDTALQAATARLESYAANGAPTLATLHDDLLAQEPAVAVAVAKGAAQNWWQRVVAELNGLITVRPLHGGDGDAMAGLEAALTKSSAAAAEAFKALPNDAQKNLADWQARLEARQHVDEALTAMADRFTSLPSVKNP